MKVLPQEHPLTESIGAMAGPRPSTRSSDGSRKLLSPAANDPVIAAFRPASRIRMGKPFGLSSQVRGPRYFIGSQIP